MGAYPRIERAPLAGVFAVRQPVGVAARRAAFGFLYRCARRKIIMKAEFNLGRTGLKRLSSLGIRSRRQNAFARPEGSFPVVNIRCGFCVRACHRANLVRRSPESSSVSSVAGIYFWNLRANSAEIDLSGSPSFEARCARTSG